ncbi:cell shape determination protein CcmA [Alkalispirochaeta sphaeroplastigenens]|uniref:Cell shape determination protein CcmA n=1 Tax=Alkalispirochaeta sphaeroplastigenens TaxID=1187066 RepID=A0A2S4K079_9SPIO|nr:MULTISPECIES: polymer-forming cytoskeletal protein [Alkalispirochaeta]POR05174.1 cell shape determination protein CcmA [Alkalispirochaeta sphaeroplastigenens]
MAELRVRTIDESELETVLGEDLDFEGTIEFSEPLLVKGRLSGEIRATSDLFVAASAEVAADVHAECVSLRGTLRGDVTAAKRLELFSGASLEGNIATPDLVVQSGSAFTGSCTMAKGAGAGSPGGSAPRKQGTPGESRNQSGETP